MPDDGRTTARLHGSASLHLRALEALHDSLFAPQFRALETYGDAPPPPPTVRDIAAAAACALAWHRSKEIEVAAVLARRRTAGSNPALIDQTARALAHHRGEQMRINAELDTLAASLRCPAPE